MAALLVLIIGIGVADLIAYRITGLPILTVW